MTQVGTYLNKIKDRLTPISETPGLDAQVLLAHLLGVNRAWVLAHPEANLTVEQSHRAAADLARLEAGQPLPYVLGEWEFYGRKFRVTPDVLIPRPETELLVEHASRWLAGHPGRRLAADVGTGSGCIAISLACQFADLRMAALDISLPALRIAWDNARLNRVDAQLLCVQADLLSATGYPLDLICANLPYIPTAGMQQLAVFGKEPDLALDGGVDGLQQIRRLLQAAPTWLAKGGAILLEIEASQGRQVEDLSRKAFPEARIRLHTDLAGRDRLVEIWQPDDTTE